jgi:predicted outer membrane protein
LIATNQQEIALSQFAQQRSQNPQVRQFAQQLAEDHTQFLSKLRQYSGLAAGPAGPQEAERPPRQTGEPGAGIERRLGADAERATTQAGGEQPAAPRTRPGEPNAPRGTNVAEQAGNLDIAQIHRQIGERCLAMTREKLQEKQGPAFDKAFVGTNIPMHIHMLASLEVLQDYASPELQKLLQQGTKTTQQHLEHAEQLMRHLDSGAQPQVPGEPRRQSAPQ